MDLVAFASGVVAAAAVTSAFLKFGRDRLLELFSVSLVAAAGVYVAFAVVGMFTGNASFGWLGTELAGAAVFLVPAFLGFRGRALPVAFGWALHSFWDLALHGGPGTGYVPWFYPVFCVGFDLAFAAFIAYYFYFRRSG